MYVYIYIYVYMYFLPGGYLAHVLTGRQVWSGMGMAGGSWDSVKEIEEEEERCVHVGEEAAVVVAVA